MSPVRLANRNPFETVIVASAFITNIPGALGLVPPPPAIAGQLGALARWWQISICLAACTILVGLLMESPRKMRISVTALVIEQVGCVALAWSCLFYAAAAVAQNGPASLSGAGLILAFALAAFNQAFKIENVLRSMRGVPQWRPLVRLLEILHLQRWLPRRVR